MSRETSAMASNIKMTFAQNLKALMGRSGVSGKQLAKALEVNPATVSQWLHCKTWPGDVHIDKMLDTYKWTEAELFAGQDSSTSELIRVHNNSNSPFRISLK